jgi:hypothetical protein
MRGLGLIDSAPSRRAPLLGITFVASGVLALLGWPALPFFDELLLAAWIFGLAVTCSFSSLAFLWRTRGARIEGWRLLALVAAATSGVFLVFIGAFVLTSSYSGID